MNGGAISLLALAALIAAVDWWAVARARRTIEYVAKPAVMLALILLAATAAPNSGSMQTWFIVALVSSLAGDVFLMLEREQFLAGLGSFLVAHLAYVAGLISAGVSLAGLAVGGVVAAAAITTVGRRIGSSVAARHRSLLTPVWAYIAAISAMLVAAVGTGLPAAIIGATLFFVSDALLGWNRFVAPLPHGRIGIIVTYHTGQALLVLAMVMQ